MAIITVTTNVAGRSKAAVEQRAARTSALSALYGPLAKAIKSSASVAVVEDEASAFLVVKTNRANIEVQISHPKEILRVAEDLEEWAVLSGDFDDATQAEEWFPANTTAAAVAKRVDALVKELNAEATAVAEALKPKRAITRKAPAVEPEPEVVEKPKRTIARKPKVTETPAEVIAPKRHITARQLPTRAKK